MQIIVKYPTRVRTYTPKDRMKRAIVSLCEKPRSSGASLLRTEARASIIKNVLQVLHDDLVYLGTRDAHTLLTRGQLRDVTTLSWKQVWQEVELAAPTLHTALTRLVPVQTRPSAVPALCTIVAMLLKLRNRKARFIQTVISLLLYGGGAKSKVSIYGMLCCGMVTVSMSLTF